MQVCWWIVLAFVCFKSFPFTLLFFSTKFCLFIIHLHTIQISRDTNAFIFIIWKIVLMGKNWEGEDFFFHHFKGVPLLFPVYNCFWWEMFRHLFVPPHTVSFFFGWFWGFLFTICFEQFDYKVPSCGFFLFVCFLYLGFIELLGSVGL